ncbi:hypothetical protein BHE74_00010915 [Ensete ventricosum]|nr:hypothetical protein BHE74_00010915 [Ensete ventricosum]
MRDLIMQRYDQELHFGEQYGGKKAIDSRRCLIEMTEELDCSSTYIRLRDPDKSKDKVERDFHGVIDPLLSWRESIGRERG